MIKLTAKNQLRRFLEDADRVEQKRSPDFSIGAHIALLIRRVEALEAAQGIVTEGGDANAAPGAERLEPGPDRDAPEAPSSTLTRGTAS